MNYRLRIQSPGRSWACSSLFAALSLFATPRANADVKLNALFSDHMVLQQGMRVPVWGTADEGEKVAVAFGGKTVSTVAHNGKWTVKLPSLKSNSKPGTLVVTGNNKIELNDVLVGEVWIASGQSNMEFALRNSYQSQNDIAAAANPNIRLFTVPKLKANQPVEDIKSSWQECDPQTSPGFSAVAYYFARDLQKDLGVPIGVIHTSWGGSPAEVWTSEDLLSGNPEYKRDILDTFAAQDRKHQEDVAKWEAESARLKAEGKQPARGRPGTGWKPTELYNGMIAPLIPYAINGAIWYQGESNAGRAYQYRSLFADMIRNWRAKWQQGDFTFLEVQLAPWDKSKKRSVEEITRTAGDSDWAELREAQWLATRTLPNVGMAVITDAGDKDDIHPTRKEPVGHRLALVAEKIAYHRHVVASGPSFKKLKVNGNEAVLSFDNVNGGLEAKDGDLKGFAIAGEDHKWVWGKAEIKGDKIIVTSPEVEKPVAVRYGWSDF
ncbi:MAG: Sialic acid-specific 9-O-acetylesterase, partial [Verrucomicrobiales bacterium]|nr:Sialic acid-specific 9-O-acetylesterase [Verrucomicrobiales bacterium]